MEVSRFSHTVRCIENFDAKFLIHAFTVVKQKNFFYELSKNELNLLWSMAISQLEVQMR